MPKAYAYATDDIIKAIIRGFWRFANEAQAIKQLSIIKERYHLSQEPDHADLDTSACLWIRGYEVSEQDKAKGIVGHFAHVAITRKKNSEYGFSIRKLEGDFKHPQKGRTPQPHPNWGHPVLRSVDAKHVYPSIAAAQKSLTMLQQEYPTTAVPGEHCLFIGIYGRVADKTDKKAKRIKRHVLEIDALPEGGFIITAKEKKPTDKKTKSPAPEVASDQPEPNAPVGFFTAKVKLKRKKK